MVKIALTCIQAKLGGLLEAPLTNVHYLHCTITITTVNELTYLVLTEKPCLVQTL